MNEESWADPDAFDRQIRALFSEEEQATMQRWPETPTPRWSPPTAGERRPVLRLAQVGAVALIASVATAAGIWAFLQVQAGAGAGDAPAATRSVSIVASSRALRSEMMAPGTTPPSTAAVDARPIAPTSPAPVAAGPAPVALPGTVAAQTQPSPAAPAPAPPSPATVAAIPPASDSPPSTPPVIGAAEAAPLPDPVTTTASTVSEGAVPADPLGTAGIEASGGTPAAGESAARTPTLGAISPGEAAAHLSRAASLLDSGQVPAARAVLLLLAERGNREAAYRYARTYDPDVLSSISALGVRGDLEIARRYYAIAAAAGHPLAKEAMIAR